jgi:F-type H+-transporting ATPase subunit epsilon
MSSTFHLRIAKVHEDIFSGDVVSASFPGEDGMLTVLAHHAPFATALKSGTISLQAPGAEKKTFTVAGGLLEVSNNQATVLL